MMQPNDDDYQVNIGLRHSTCYGNSNSAVDLSYYERYNNLSQLVLLTYIINPYMSIDVYVRGRLVNFHEANKARIEIVACRLPIGGITSEFIRMGCFDNDPDEKQHHAVEKYLQI
jgi:hypothetical protein